jgi:hypothetical protein
MLNDNFICIMMVIAGLVPSLMVLGLATLTAISTISDYWYWRILE